MNIPKNCFIGAKAEFFHRGNWVEGFVDSIDEKNLEVFINCKQEEYQIGLEDYPKFLRFPEEKNNIKILIIDENPELTKENFSKLNLLIGEHRDIADGHFN